MHLAGCSTTGNGRSMSGMGREGASSCCRPSEASLLLLAEGSLRNEWLLALVFREDIRFRILPGAILEVKLLTVIGRGTTENQRGCRGPTKLFR